MKFKKILIAASLASLFSFSASPAFADDMPTVPGALAGPASSAASHLPAPPENDGVCKSDVEKLCKGIQPGEGRIV